jgi:hypothetical protein
VGGGGGDVSVGIAARARSIRDSGLTIQDDLLSIPRPTLTVRHSPVAIRDDAAVMLGRDAFFTAIKRDLIEKTRRFGVMLRFLPE